MWHPVSAEATASLLAAMDARSERPPGTSGDDSVWVVRRHDDVRAGPGWGLVLEDGTELEGNGSLPPDLPMGYHDLSLEPGRRVRLVVAPPRCHLPDGMRLGGWAAQLPALRSSSSWGIGDLADLRAFGRWARGRGCEVAMLSPLHAPAPISPLQPSPYYASSRCFRNPLYLRVEELEGASTCRSLEEAAAAGRALNGSRLIDRDAVWDLKSAVLAELWPRSAAHRGEHPGFQSFRRAQGEALAGFSTFCALSEVHGGPWQEWPAPLRRPDSAEVRDFAARNADRIAYHAWLQFLIDQQLSSAAGEIGLVADLAIGSDPAGADAWLWQDVIASSVRVGAPPDDFNAAGQDWGLPPFDPWKLRQAAFEPFILTLRNCFAHSAGIRIDHIAGLFRLFWLPEDGSPADGGYVRYPWEELLGVLALESQRAASWVVGEDLGTVEDRVREEMERRSLLSMKVLWFESEPPQRYPYRSMATLTTHDLPTVAGLWSGSDAAEMQRVGLAGSEGFAPVRERLAEWTGSGPGTAPAEVIRSAYRLLARAPSAVALATLEDATATEERPNLPGTVDERANWSMALPASLEEIIASDLALDIAESVAARPESE